MALRIELAPHEGFYVGTALLRNGARRTDFAIESKDVRLLREMHVRANPDVAMAYLRGDPGVTFADVRGRDRQR